jgi:Raf kinase inhibitor-like YbhB/YbcL family protein
MSMRKPIAAARRRGGMAAKLSILAVFTIFGQESAMTRAATPSFTVTTPGLADGAVLPPRHAGSGDCGGENISPALAWTGVPEATKSFAIVVYDPDGGKGLGSVHFVAYDIPAAAHSFAEGAGAGTSGGFVGGTNTRGINSYAGPCPPAGDQPHHYVFSVYALDLAPGTLTPGLTRDLFLQAVRGHVLAASSIVLRYARVA